MRVDLITFSSVNKGTASLTIEEVHYQCLIVEHLSFIEKQCRKATDSPSTSRSEADIDNEADLLLAEVLDHLKADDYKVLRNFRGSAKLTTYLTAVIANLVVDIARTRYGRSRARERAKDIGPVAELLHELVYGRGYTLADAHGHLVLSYGITESEDDLRGMLDQIRGRDGTQVMSSDWPYKGREVLVDDEVEVIVPDPAKGAEEIMIGNQRDRKREQTMAAMLEGLSGEESFILRLRFPAMDDQKPRSVREIAALLGLTEKAVDNRLRRTLLRCREMLLSQGLSLDDLISVGE
uniref:RNA polymerase, sigma-24 subunit, ECF subfamily n=1 Tax=Geobacter sp. (strain M21) TaxID=443144 RepID=C6DZB2_GEOSM